MKTLITKYTYSLITLILLVQMMIFSSGLEAQERPAFKRVLPLAFLQIDALLATPNGTIYAAEGFNGTRIFQITPDGNTSVYASGLNGPIDMALDTQGNMYVTNFLGASVSKVTPMGEVSHFADTFDFPSGIVIDHQDNLFVSQYGATDPNTGAGIGNAVQKIDSNAQVSIFSQGDMLQAPVGITLDDDGNIYTANFHNGKVVRINSNGQQELVAQPTPSEAFFAIGHLEYAEGKLFATGIQTQALYKINPNNGRFRAKDISNRVRFPNGITYDFINESVIISNGLANVASLVRYPVKVQSED